MEQLDQLNSEAAAIRALKELCSQCPERGNCLHCMPTKECLAKVRSVEFHERLKLALNASSESEEVIEAHYDRFEDVWRMAIDKPQS